MITVFVLFCIIITVLGIMAAIATFHDDDDPRDTDGRYRH